MKKSRFEGIGKRCYLARKKSGLTQQQLAMRHGWSSRRNVGAIENERELPSLEYLDTLCDLCDVSLIWLVSGEGSRGQKGDAVFAQWLDLMLRTPDDCRAGLLTIAQAAQAVIVRGQAVSDGEQ